MKPEKKKILSEDARTLRAKARRDFLKKAGLLGVAGAAGALAMAGADRNVFATSPPTGFGQSIDTGFGQEQAYSALVWTDGTYYYVKDGYTGQLIVNKSLLTAWGATLTGGTAGTLTNTGGVQEAVSYAANLLTAFNNGARIFIRNGTYTGYVSHSPYSGFVSSTHVIIPENLTLSIIGESERGVQLCGDTMCVLEIQSSGTNALYIENLYLNGSAYSQYCLYTSGSNNLSNTKFKNVWYANPTAGVIYNTTGGDYAVWEGGGIDDLSYSPASLATNNLITMYLAEFTWIHPHVNLDFKNGSINSVFSLQGNNIVFIQPDIGLGDGSTVFTVGQVFNTGPAQQAFSVINPKIELMTNCTLNYYFYNNSSAAGNDNALITVDNFLGYLHWAQYPVIAGNSTGNSLSAYQYHQTSNHIYLARITIPYIGPALIQQGWVGCGYGGFNLSKSLPAGTGSSYKVQNTYNEPILIYLPSGTTYGTHVIDAEGNDRLLGEDLFAFLNANEYIYFVTAVPVSWNIYGVIT